MPLLPNTKQTILHPTAKKSEYIFRSLFDSTFGLGLLPNPMRAENGSLDLVQTDGQFSTTGKTLNFIAQSTPVWGDQGLYNPKSLTRVSGRTLHTKVSFSTFGECIPVAWSSAATVNFSSFTNVIHGIYIANNSGDLQVIDSSVATPTLATLQLNVVYELRIILRKSGAHYCIKGGRFPIWTRLWVSGSTTTDNLYCSFSNYAAAGYIDDVYITDLPDFKTDEDAYTNRLTNPVAYPTANSTTSSRPDAIIEWTGTFNGTAMEVSTRFADTNNRFSVRISAAGSLLFNQTIKGVATTLSTTAAAAVSGNTYKFRIIQDDTTYRIFQDNILRFTYTDPEAYLIARQGVVVIAVSGGISELTVWSRFPDLRLSSEIPWPHEGLASNLYAQMANFETYLRNLTPTASVPLKASAEFLTGNANNLDVSTSGKLSANISTNRLYIDAFVAAGCEAITINVGFPVLIQTYGNGDPNPNYVNNRAFYADIIGYAKSLGLVVAVEMNILFDAANQSGVIGFNYAVNYPYLTGDPEPNHLLFDGLITQATYILQNYAPDYLSLVGEPSSHMMNVGRDWTVAEYTKYVNDALAAFTAAGVRNVSSICVGTGSWENQDYFNDFMINTDADVFNLHIFPLSNTQFNFLENAVVMCDTAIANGKRIIICQSSAYKAFPSVVTPQLDYVSIFRLDMFDKWLPLDKRFLYILDLLCRTRGIELMTFFWTMQFFYYVPYNKYTSSTPYADGDRLLRLGANPNVVALNPGPLGELYGTLGDPNP